MSLEEMENLSHEQRDYFFKMMGIKIDSPAYKEAIKNKLFLKNLLLRMIADTRLIRSCLNNIDNAILHVPITAFSGKQDEVVSVDEMKTWKTLTDQAFDLQILAGDHFFLQQEKSQDKMI